MNKFNKLTTVLGATLLTTSLVTSASLAKSGEMKYLREIVSKSNMLEIANSPLFRIDFSLGRESIPTINAYFKQKGLELETAEPDVRNETLNAWVQEFYPPMTEEQLLQELNSDSHMRAFVVTFTLLLQALQLQGQIPAIPQLYKFAIGHAMLWEAIDKDVAVQDLMMQRDQAKSMFSVGFSDENEYDVPRDRNFVYADAGAYLLRANHIRPLPLPDETRDILQERGYRQEQVELMSTEAANALLTQKVLPEPDSGLALDLDTALLVDLLSEPLIINASIPSPYQLERSDSPVTEYIADEMLTTWAEVGEQVIALLNDKDNPASLFQIVQLVRIGFTLDEIIAMTYATRDAVILANPVSKSSFIAAEGEDISAWNTLIAEKGALTFLLRRYHHSLDAINPHHPIDVDRHIELLTRAEQIQQVPSQ